MLLSLRAVPEAAVKTGGPWHTLQMLRWRRPCRCLGGGGACNGITGSGRSCSTASENGAELRNQKPATSNALVSNELSSRGEQESSLRDRESPVYSTELERVRTGRPGETGVMAR